jgi:hypothetical protein
VEITQQRCSFLQMFFQDFLGRCRFWLGCLREACESFELSIHVANEFSHNRGEGNFDRLAGSPQTFVNNLEYRVASRRTQSRHVKGRTHLGASATDAAFAFHFAAVVVPGSQSGQRRRLTPVHLPQLGHVCQYGNGRAEANSLDGVEAFESARQFLIALHQLLDLFLGILDLRLVIIQQLLVLPLDKRIVLMFGDGFEAGLGQDQLFEPEGQCGQLLLDLGRGRRGLGLEALTVIGEHTRVNAVVFGPLALGFGGVADLGGIDQGDGDFGLVHGLEQWTFIPSGGFTNDVESAGRLKLVTEFCKAFNVIADFDLTAFEIHLEGGFGDVNSDMDGNGLSFHIMANVLTHPYEYELSA